MSIIGNSLQSLIDWRNGESSLETGRPEPVANPSSLTFRRVVTLPAGFFAGIFAIMIGFVRTIVGSIGILANYIEVTRPFYQREFIDIRNGELIGGAAMIAYSISQIATSRFEPEET